MLDEERQKHASECKSGRGKRCDGIATSIGVYEDAVKGNEAKLKELGPKEPVAPKVENFANLLALFGADKAQVKATLMLGEPFLYTLLFEVGSIVAWGYAFRNRTAERSEQNRRNGEQTSFPPSSDDELPDLSRQFGLVTPNGSRPDGPATRRFAKDEAAADLVTRLALGERFGSQDELRERYGVAKSTMSDWLRAWERSGLIPARRPAGRCKVLSS